jgi:hypothetical protein
LAPAGVLCLLHLTSQEEQPVRLASILDVLQKICTAGCQPGQEAAAAAAVLQLPAGAREASAASVSEPPFAPQLNDDDDEDEEVHRGDMKRHVV